MKKKNVLCLVATSLFVVGTATVASATEEEKESYLIGFQNDQVLEQFVDMIENPREGMLTSTDEMIDFSIEHKYEEISAVLAELTVEEAKSLKEFGNISYIEKDELMTTMQQTTPKSVKQIKAPTAHRRGLSGSGVKVAVIDTGVGPHPDLNVVGGVSFIKGESYSDKNGHGTHVAGTIAALDNGIGVVGVAPEADLYAVNVLGKNGSAATSTVIQGVEWAIENDMDVVNMSLGGGDHSDALEAAVNAARENDVLIVAASGNNGQANVSYPARYYATLSVGAVDDNNERADFSQYGYGLDIVAPGVDVLSTYLDGDYAELSGTSMATPAVSGAVALLKEKYPYWDADQIEWHLLSNTNWLGSHYKYGYGLVDLDQATK